MSEGNSEQTILIVDQEIEFLDWATKHLFAKNLKILRTDSAENAVKILAKTHIDVVISAIDLQPFDGMELLNRVKTESPSTLVILNGGFPTTGQVIEATQRGAHDVLRKESLAF